MLRPVIAIALIMSTAFANAADKKKGDILVLEAHKEVIEMGSEDKKIEWKAQIFSCDADANGGSWSGRCQSRLVINDVEYQIPDAIFDRLLANDGLRRSVGYDEQTGGIVTTDTGIRCLMAGPSSGIVLKTLYPIKGKHTEELKEMEMKTIYTQPLSCNYMSTVSLKDEYAQTSARLLIEVIQTVKEMLVKK